jgi:hypothetical protein
VIEAISKNAAVGEILAAAGVAAAAGMAGPELMNLSLSVLSRPFCLSMDGSIPIGLLSSTGEMS